MALNYKKIRKEFETRLKDCKNDPLKALAYLNEQDLDSDYVQKLILEPLNGKEFDAIKYTLNNRNYKLFIAFLYKVDAKKYFTSHDDLLELAIEAKSDKDKRLAAVLTAYDRFGIDIDLQELPDKTLKKLYEESWSGEIIKRLYDKADSFFIPRGQNKAKMQAMIFYNKFGTKSSKHPKRINASEESDAIHKGLTDAGFTVPAPTIDWTKDELIERLSSQVHSIGINTSVLVICIMTHGDLGILYDKLSEPVEINKVLKTVRGQLPQHIPLVMLIQSCQGSMDPDQAVKIQFKDGVHTDAAVSVGPSVRGEPSAPGGSETASACPRVSPIIVNCPETIVVTATPPGYSANRNHFFQHLANQLKLSNGITLFASLLTRTSNAMAKTKTDDPSYSAQAPLTQNILNKDLILPKSLVYDKHTKMKKKGFIRKWAGIASEALDMIRNSVKSNME